MCKAIFLTTLCFLSLSCSKPDPVMVRRQALAEMLAGLRGCVPQTIVESAVTLAIVNVTRGASETRVRVVAYATNEAAEFDWPVYSLSRGRWVINEKDRAYLVDDVCREYRLKDKSLSTNREAPVTGRIRLKTGEAFEAELLFPPLPDGVRMGVLVYGARVLPFSLLPEAVSDKR